MLRNPPNEDGAPHIRRIMPSPDKGGKPKLNHVARLIRPTMGDFYLPYAVDTICPPSVPQPNEYKWGLSTVSNAFLFTIL